MFFKIKHEIRYTYSEEVFIEPITLRLRPRSDCFQKLHHFEIRSDPLPKGQSEAIDLDGNSVTCIWSGGLNRYITINANSLVETLNQNPFNFILTEDSSYEIPISYSPELDKALGAYLEREYTAVDIDHFANEVIKNSGANTINFLTNLNQHIFENFEKIERPQGNPQKPIETLTLKKGSCRDLTVLFMDACRFVGLATRFTSGYFYNEEIESSKVQLHAWAEVYLPGGGWRGYDPTHGLATADRHIAVASAGSPKMASPTFGMYRGTGVSSNLEFEVSLEAFSSLEDIPLQK